MLLHTEVTMRRSHRKEGTHNGINFQPLTLEFVRAGGDEDSCPFDAEDYQYIGPTISWSGVVPFISPSEFPREFV